jgi:cupin superfamily acireductone dioxygenase involved in methionine salvage
MEELIKARLTHLYEMKDKYNELVNRTGGHYHWRAQAIEAQIEALENVLYNRPDQWQECYKEDSEEAKREGYIKK